MTCPAILKLWATYPEMASFAERAILFQSGDVMMLFDKDDMQRVMVVEAAMIRSERMHQMLDAMKKLNHEWAENQMKSPVDFLQAGIESILFGSEPLGLETYQREVLDALDRDVWMLGAPIFDYGDRAGKHTWLGRRPPKYLSLKQRHAWHAPQRKHKRGKSKK